MPLAVFTQWVQLEIYRKQYEKAGNLIRKYIYQSTRLNEGEKQEEMDVFGMRRWATGVSKDLPLSKDGFYELIELLVFNVMLPY